MIPISLLPPELGGVVPARARMVVGLFSRVYERQIAVRCVVFSYTYHQFTAGSLLLGNQSGRILLQRCTTFSLSH